MADRFFGLDRGDDGTQVTEQASSPAKDVEVVVDDAVGLNKKDVRIALERIMNWIEDKNTTIPGV